MITAQMRHVSLRLKRKIIRVVRLASTAPQLAPVNSRSTVKKFGFSAVLAKQVMPFSGSLGLLSKQNEAAAWPTATPLRSVVRSAVGKQREVGSLMMVVGETAVSTPPIVKQYSSLVTLANSAR